jgi:hypothetical protein
MFLVTYEMGFYILEDGILHSHRCEKLKSYYVYILQNIFTILIAYERDLLIF